MYLTIKNENNGYAVATYGDYVVVGNPALTRYDALTASVHYTGSLDYYRYNKTSDQHDLIGTLYLSGVDMNILLAGETGSVPSQKSPLHTEANNTGSSYNKDIEIDKNFYTSSLEDGIGLSIDIYDKLLVAGSPYYLENVHTSASSFSTSGSIVNVFNLGLSEFTLSPTSSLYAYSLENPDPQVSESFGRSVSINANWLAVGSPYVSSSNGMVYIYRNTSTGSSYSWDLFQKIEASSVISASQFGHSLKLNKQSGSFSGSLVVGCGNLVANKAFYFQFISGSWRQTFIFTPDTETEYPLTFGNFDPYSVSLNTTNGYGYSVSTFQDTVIIGEYLDRTVYEYSGSDAYQQGSVSIYERCPNDDTRFDLVLKTYGTSSIMKNNQLGYSVDIFANNAIAGIPKINRNSTTSCFIGGTLQQLHQCEDNLEISLNGQAMLLQKNTSSGDWGITNIYQRKKRFLTPYRHFGSSVGAGVRSIVVGAPMSLSDTNREINLDLTASNGVDIDDVSGKAYIYNLANLRSEFHVGNVFYRNGKIILMTSGSVFDQLFYNPFSSTTYEYDINFKGQHTIFEKQVVCSISPGEFNVSTNPSATTRNTSSLDVNRNGRFDFQDVDVLMRYMQYKNTTQQGLTVSTDWSSSIVTADDEISLLNWYQDDVNYDPEHTSIITSESIVRWETTDMWMQDVLDFNQDNKIDERDLSIMWKYFANRLTQENYAQFITPSCTRKLFSDIIDHLNYLSQKHAIPQIKSQFLDYERLTTADKTGSYAAPLATAIGLYDGLDLVAVAKLGSPIKITPELPINFVVKMDF
jgi:hypothetical protein